MDINNIDEKQWKGEHKFLGSEGLLCPGVNMTDCNRRQMFDSHINQCVQIEGAETPIMFTRFENEIGKHTTGYKRLVGNWHIVTKIYKNKYNYAMIVQNVDTDEIDVVFRSEARWLTEHYCSKLDNHIIDSLKDDEEISNKVIYKDLNYDNMLNFQYGTNLNAVYLTYKGYSNEDAIIISESAANKMATYYLKKIRVNVNTNDLLINLYGNKKEYKSFPDIGEEIKNGLLLSRRRINYSKSLNELRDLKHPLTEDSKYYASGKVVDIDIFSNIVIDVLESQVYNKQIVHYINKNNEFYKNFIEYIDTIKEELGEDVLSSEIKYYYHRYKIMTNNYINYIDNNRNFDGYLIELSILEKVPVKLGSKISGRYGNKGVVSLILPDDEMPTIEKIDNEDIDPNTKIGMRADIILNPLGVINRLNPSQLIEQEINYISKVIRYRIEKSRKAVINEEEITDDLLKEVIEYIKDVHKEEGILFEKFVSSLNEEDKEELLNNIIENGIPVHQPPFYNNNGINELAKLYKKYNIDYIKCKDIEQPLIMGELYFIRLKHEAENKASVRSMGSNNQKNIPTKSLEYKQGKNVLNNTPVKQGEMETTNLAMANPAKDWGMKPIKKLLDSYANNPELRKRLVIELLTGNPFEPDIPDSVINDEEINNSNNAKIVESLLKSIGYKIEK